jgi:hypothetical protein
MNIEEFKGFTFRSKGQLEIEVIDFADWSLNQKKEEYPVNVIYKIKGQDRLRTMGTYYFTSTFKRI